MTASLDGMMEATIVGCFKKPLKKSAHGPHRWFVIHLRRAADDVDIEKNALQIEWIMGLQISDGVASRAAQERGYRPPNAVGIAVG